MSQEGNERGSRSRRRPTDWSRWAPTGVVLIGWAFAAGVAYNLLTSVRADIAVIEARLSAHVQSEGHMQTLRRMDRFETELRHTEGAVQGLGTDLGKLEAVMQRVDRRTEALCAESPQCRGVRE